jgi:hypothetical protein
MKIRITLALTALLVQGAAVSAAEIKVLSAAPAFKAKGMEPAPRR